MKTPLREKFLVLIAKFLLPTGRVQLIMDTKVFAELYINSALFKVVSAEMDRRVAAKGAPPSEDMN